MPEAGLGLPTAHRLLPTDFDVSRLTFDVGI